MLDGFDEFVERDLGPLEQGADWAEHDQVPATVAEKVRHMSGELGFYGADFPTDDGGLGVDEVGSALLRMRAGAHRCRLAQVAVSGPEGPTRLLLAGTPEQRRRYLHPLVRGRAIRALALTEPEVGSDVSALRCRAERTSGGWLLNGVKSFVTNGAEADFVIVFAVTEPAAPPLNTPRVTAFLVDRDTPGLSVRREVKGMWSGNRRYELGLRDCRVPAGSVLGGDAGVGNALWQALDNFGDGRLAIAATCVGLATQALAVAVAHARERHAFGVPIGQHQHVQEHLVTAHMETAAAELLVLRAAWRASRHLDTPADAALAKLAAAEKCFRAVDSALQVLGGLGYTRDVPVERLLREVRMYRIVDGTSEIQKVIVARTLLDL